MELTSEFLHETALFVQEYYATEFTDDYCFHNFARAGNIARNAVTLGVQMGLNKEEVSILHVAALFLETGYCKNYENHQSASVELANNYLKEKAIGDVERQQVEEIILSTRAPQHPVTLQAQVLCDASKYHLGEKSLTTNLESLRTERKLIAGKEYTDIDWIKENISMLQEHYYFTSAARDEFEKKMQKQKAALEEQLFKWQNAAEVTNSKLEQPKKSEKVSDISLDDIKLERGVETFFRVTERRHIDLSTKAHDKASLLISVNSIVVSIVLSVLITKLEENRHLLLPTLLLVITCVTTIILSIISTRPRFIKKQSSPLDTSDDEVNILFFGDFSKMSLTDYKKAMKETYRDKNKLYDSLSKDIYYQGIILVWKYKFLNIAYTVFMYGFIITILSFIAAFVIRIT